MPSLRRSKILIAMLLGVLSCTRPPQPAPSAPPHERIWVPLSNLPLRGPATAGVTVVVFSDYASPYCARVHEQLTQLRQQYKEELRVQFRSRPLPNHADAPQAAEAAMAAARLGCQTAILTQNLDTISQMSCNPAIGGLAKGNVVREIDALGGVMGLNTDATGVQFRMLNARKGPSVQSPRAQCDKKAYQFRHNFFL